jgi:hypothetical protein
LIATFHDRTPPGERATQSYCILPPRGFFLQIQVEK